MVSQLRSQTAGRRVTCSQSAGPKPERKDKSRKLTNQTPRYAGISFASEQFTFTLNTFIALVWNALSPELLYLPKSFFDSIAEYITKPENSDQEKSTSTSGAEFIQTTHSPPPQLVVRLFARNYYPNKPRLNIYSKATIIGSIVKSLKETSELDKLLGSQFGSLFRLPVARCLNSAKLVHSLVSCQLVMLLKYELWFLFTDNPL